MIWFRRDCSVDRPLDTRPRAGQAPNRTLTDRSGTKTRPLAENLTCSISFGPGNEEMMTSACLRMSVMSSVHVAPCSQSGFSVSGQMSWTTRFLPACNRFAAIGPPIVPRPMKPIESSIWEPPLETRVAGCCDHVSRALGAVKKPPVVTIMIAPLRCSTP